MKNELPIMPIRAMYADKSVHADNSTHADTSTNADNSTYAEKSTEGKDLNKVGDIVPVVVPLNGWTLDLLKKACEVGVFDYDNKRFFVSHVDTSGGDNYYDMYATSVIDDETNITVLNVYNDGDAVELDAYDSHLLTGQTVGTKLYKHSLVYTGNTVGRVTLTLVTSFEEPFTLNTDYTDARFGLKTTAYDSVTRVLRWVYEQYPSVWATVYSNSYNLKIFNGNTTTFLFVYDSTATLEDNVTAL